jgi:hypothetical protein
VMAAGGLDGVDRAAEDPLLKRGIADAEGGSCFTRLEEDVVRAHSRAGKYTRLELKQTASCERKCELVLRDERQRFTPQRRKL